jgi:putative ABC transport system substrate-binding protein
MSSAVAAENARRGAAAEAHGSVFKPFESEDFRKAVIKTLGVAALAAAGVLSAGRSSAADVQAVLSADTRLYREAWDGFRETFGSEAALTVLNDAGVADAPKDARVVVAFGAKAALRRVPSGARLIVVMAPSVGERDGLKAGFVRVGMSPDAPELLSRMMKLQPGLRRLGFVWKSPLYGREFLPRLEAAARVRGVEIVAAEVSSDDVLPDVLRSLYGRVDALWLPPDPLLISQRSFLILRDFSQSNRVPLYAPTAGLAEQGAAASIGASFREIGREAGRAARRALAGEDQPSLRFPSPAETVLNREAAAKSGLAVDAAALKTADRVIP